MQCLKLTPPPSLFTPASVCLCAVFHACQGLEAILRVRCSSGLDVESYTGSFYKPVNSPTDLYLPAIDCDKALVAKLDIMEKLPVNSEVCRGVCHDGWRWSQSAACFGGGEQQLLYTSLHHSQPTAKKPNMWDFPVAGAAGFGSPCACFDVSLLLSQHIDRWRCVRLWA